MSLNLENKLVIGVAPSAWFDLEKFGRVLVQKGGDSFVKNQRKHLDQRFQQG